MLFKPLQIQSFQVSIISGLANLKKHKNHREKWWENPWDGKPLNNQTHKYTTLYDGYLLGMGPLANHVGKTPGMGENPLIITLNDGVTFLGPCETLISSCKPCFFVDEVHKLWVSGMYSGHETCQVKMVFFHVVCQPGLLQTPPDRIEGSKIPSPNGHRNIGKISRKFWRVFSGSVGGQPSYSPGGSHSPTHLASCHFSGWNITTLGNPRVMIIITYFYPSLLNHGWKFQLMQHIGLGLISHGAMVQCHNSAVI